ncbi:DUF3068 domain-containing protein [Gordonia alkaliphila]
MRRVAMALLAFLGLACIAAAITIPTYLVGQLKVVPLDLDITSDAGTVSAPGESASRFPAVIFDRCSVTKSKAALLNVNLVQQRRSIIVEPSNADQATLQSAQTVLIDRVEGRDGKETVPTVAPADEERKCSDGLLTANIDRVSVNRKTSAPNGVVSSLQLEADTEGVPLEDVSVQLEDRKGFQYKFGFDVQKQDYYYYDLNTRQDTVASFVEEKTIQGLKVYHFKTEVPETDLSDLPNPQGEAPLGTILNMPAKWWGISGRGIRSSRMINMHRFATAERHVYVEPVTGTIVDGYEEQHQYFRSVDDSENVPAAIRDFRMDALNANFQWSEATVTEQVQRADKYVNLLKWGGTYVPIILGVLGALMLAVWGLLVFRGRKDGDPSDDGGDGNGEHGDGDDPNDGPLDDGPAAGDLPGYDFDGRSAGAHTAVIAAPAAAAATEVIPNDPPTTALPDTPAVDDPDYWGRPIDAMADTVSFRPIPDLDLPPLPGAPVDDFAPIEGNPIADIPVPPEDPPRTAPPAP